jgi:hypothetical protein
MPDRGASTRGSHPFASPLATTLCVACAGLAYLVLYVWRVRSHVAAGTGDFLVYVRTARAVLAGASPYTTNWIYPPFLGYVLAPLGALSYPAAAWTWFVLQHVCIVFAAAWTARALRDETYGWVAVALTWAAAGSIVPLLLEGQVGALLLALLVLVLWPPRGRPWVGSAALAAATAIKIWPALLLAGELVSRRWRRLAVAVAWTTALVAIPWLAVAATTDGPLRPPLTNWMGTPAFLNHSLPGTVLRLCDPLVPGSRLPANWVEGNVIEGLRLSVRDAAIGKLVVAATVALGLAMLLWSLRGAAPADERVSRSARVAAALVSLAVLASPVCWPHYEVVQLPGCALLASLFGRQRRWTPMALLVAAFLVVQWTEAWVMGPYIRTHGAMADAPLEAWALTTLPTIALATIFALHLHALGRSRADRA